MEPIQISLKMISPNCKPVHTCAHTVPRSVEQQYLTKKGNCKFVDIGVLEEVFSSE
jgi:hypothetical protein